MGKNIGKKIGKGVGMVILAAAVGVGVFFGCRMAHDKGYEAGLAVGRAEKDDKIEELAKAVVAKNEVLKVLDGVTAPATVTDANVDGYLKELETAYGEFVTKAQEILDGRIK